MNLIFLLSGSVGGSFVVVDVSIFVVYLVWGFFFVFWVFFWGWGGIVGLSDWFGGLFILVVF